MTLLKAPTGTLLCYYKDIKQEIVHTLLLKEYLVSKKWVIIMDKRQDKTAGKKALQARFFCDKTAPQAILIKKENAKKAIFID